MLKRAYWHRLLLLAVLSISCLTGTGVYALDPTTALTQYRYRNWTGDQGAPTDTISNIAQTPDLYLWLATESGLVRFDGQRFHSFNRRNTPAMKSNGVREVCTTDDGVLWVGTANGLLRYEDGQFSFIDLVPERVEGTWVRAQRCRGNTVYVGTTLGEVFRVDGLSVKAIDHWKPVSDSMILALELDAQERLVIATLEAGLHRCDARACAVIESELVPGMQGFYLLERSRHGGVGLRRSIKSCC